MLKREGSGQLQASHGANRIADHDTGMIKNLLEFCGGRLRLMRRQIGATAHKDGIERAKEATPPQVLQFKAVLWQNGAVHELPSVAGDPEGVAFAINENGQAVGGTGICGTFNPATYVYLQPLHAVLWQNGTATDLGNLGGDGHGFGILALGLNNVGQVVGVSDLPGDTAFHGFVWTQGTGMRDLGTLPGDVGSSAISINDHGQIVGVSLDSNFNIRPFFRSGGPLLDLNTLIPANSSLYLLLACSINNRGEIIGLGVDINTGEAHGYLLIPNGN